MSRSPDNESSTAADKKRLRDRRAQNARRERQATYTQLLEAQVTECRDSHQAELARLRGTIDGLRQENAALRERQSQVINLLVGSSATQRAVPELHQSQLQASCHLGSLSGINVEHWNEAPRTLAFDHEIEQLMPWLVHPVIAMAQPDVPSGSELMYGSCDNTLANTIHAAVRAARFGLLTDHDRLAFGWLSYIYAVWRFRPSVERFARLPSWLRPTQLQRSQPHSALIDIVFWPELRDALITAEQSGAELVTTLRDLCPTLARPWPLHIPLLQPGRRASQGLKINDEFLQSISKLENWTYAPEFAVTHPNLIAASE